MVGLRKEKKEKNIKYRIYNGLRNYKKNNYLQHII